MTIPQEEIDRIIADNRRGKVRAFDVNRLLLEIVVQRIDLKTWEELARTITDIAAEEMARQDEETRDARLLVRDLYYFIRGTGLDYPRAYEVQAYLRTWGMV